MINLYVFKNYLLLINKMLKTMKITAVPKFYDFSRFSFQQNQSIKYIATNSTDRRLIQQKFLIQLLINASIKGLFSTFESLFFFK